MHINRTKTILPVVLTILIAGLIFLVALPKKEMENSLVQLNASASYNGSRITVSNNDTVDYLNAQITVNEYYRIENINLSAGETYTFWPVEFAHVNGRRLPAKQKPQQFSIWCSLPDDSKGFYSIKFSNPN